MDFLFGKKTDSDSMPASVIRNQLISYAQISNSTPDYHIGDFITLKPGVHSLGLIREHLRGYVLELNQLAEHRYLGEDNNLTIAILDRHNPDNVIIVMDDARLYRRVEDHELVFPVLKEFSQATPINRAVKPGELVQNRKNYKPRVRTSIKNKDLLTPYVVIRNKEGKVTVAAYLENENRIIEKSFRWYELSPYIDLNK